MFFTLIYMSLYDSLKTNQETISKKKPVAVQVR